MIKVAGCVTSTFFLANYTEFENHAACKYYAFFVLPAVINWISVGIEQKTAFNPIKILYVCSAAVACTQQTGG